MIEGRLNVFFKEECLLEQDFVVSETKGETVAKHLKQLSGKLGGEVVVHRFLKFERGEGIAQKKVFRFVRFLSKGGRGGRKCQRTDCANRMILPRRSLPRRRRERSERQGKGVA